MGLISKRPSFMMKLLDSLSLLERISSKSTFVWANLNYFFNLYPEGHLGFNPEIVLLDLPLVQIIETDTGFADF